MFDFGFGELLLLAVIGLVVLGPERLPVAARLLGRWIRGARSQWNAVKAELENELADEELRRNLREASTALRQGVQPLQEAGAGLADATAQMTRIPASTASMASTPSTAANPGAVAPIAHDPMPPDAGPIQMNLLDPAPPAGNDAPRHDG